MDLENEETYRCPKCGADTKTTLEALQSEKVKAICKNCGALIIDAPFDLSKIIRGFPKR